MFFFEKSSEMSHYNVDVRTPIFFRQSFASSLETQSNKTYSRLTHTPLIAGHLPRGAASGVRIAQYGTSRLRSLDELEKLLHTVLEDAGAKLAATSALALSTREPGPEELERTAPTPAPAAVVQAPEASQAQTPERSDRGDMQCTTSLASESLFAAHGDHHNAPSSTSARRLRRSVSFPPASCSATPRLQPDVADEKSAVAASTAQRVWYRLRGWVWRGSQPPPPPQSPSLLATARQREDIAMAGGGGGAADLRREYTISAFWSAPSSQSPQRTSAAATAAIPTSAASSSYQSVPTWVRAAFTPAAAALAVATVNRAHPALSRGVDATAIQATDAGAPEDERADEEEEEGNGTLTSMSREDTVPLAGGMNGGRHSALLSGAFVATSDTAASVGTLAMPSSSKCDPLSTDVKSAASSQSTRSLHPHCNAQTQPYSAADGEYDATSSSCRRAGAESMEDGLKCSSKTDVPADNNNNAAHEAPRATEQHSVLSHTTAGTNVLARWDRHVYAVELVGWLNLLVWIRCQVIHFLRDLSGVQGFVAWSAWYWSWAQEHPRQASFHQALSSRRFWRGLWLRGLSAQLSEVQYETSGHMFTLKNAFRLIVSYIGAAYTSLDQLNSVILQIQHRCEMTTSPMAAAAAAAAARSCTASLGAAGGTSGGVGGAAGVGVSTTTVPELNGSINRACMMGRRDFLSNQNNVLWSSTPVTVLVDDFSPLAPRPRGNIESRVENVNAAGVRGGPHRSAFEDAYEQDSVNETAVAEAAEEAEAAAALQVLDELRYAIWAMLDEQRAMFRFNGQQLDVLESNDFFGWLGDHRHAGVPLNADNVLLSASMLGDGFPGSPSTRPHEEPRAPGEEQDGDRPVTARDGAVALLQCVQQSRRLVQRLKALVQRAHNPPASRHWQRILVAAAATIPPFFWLYCKTPAELLEFARSRYRFGQQLMRYYLLEPIAQLRESFFYVRPGVEDRRGAFERDAASLANIIRDFHEDMYPNMSLDRLEQLRNRTLDRLRAGVADPEGYGLIDQQYRHSVRHPIRSVVFGDLPRIILIQMSYQALEMSRVANGVDEVLEGNDLNFKIMALLPVFAAGSLLVTWVLFRYRANHKPVRMRMKLLWRSLCRVIGFAGSGQQMLPPCMNGAGHHPVAGVRLADPPTRFPRCALSSGAPAANTTTTTNINANNTKSSRGRPGAAKGGIRFSAAGAGAASPAPTAAWPRRADERQVEEVDPAGFSMESSEEDASFAAASVNARVDGVAAVQQLNNYEQGMVLLLSHVIRSLAAEYLHSYEYFHELLEDLNDLESVQSSRHQRLATLERMRSTHTFLF